MTLLIFQKALLIIRIMYNIILQYNQLGFREADVTSQIDIVCDEAIASPAKYFGALREETPVIWDENSKSWIVTSYQAITDALQNDAFSSDRIVPYIQKKLSGDNVDPLTRQAFDVLAKWLVFQDNPEHARLRALVNKAFTARSVARLRDRVESLCESLMDNVPAEGEFDLLATVAAPLPSIVIAELLGVPVEDRKRFEGWTALVAPLVSGGFQDPERYDRISKGMDELLIYFRGLIERYKKHPEENLITELIAAREADDTLSEIEMLATCTLILFGGHETTANLISNSLVMLLDAPEQLEALREDRVTGIQAIEECLRYAGPGKAMTRVMKQDLEFYGKSLKKGDRVFLIVAAGNRDPSVFDEPEKLKLDRKFPKRHLAFGSGVHFCMGAQLARLEASIVVPMIVKRFPKLARTDKPLQWMPVLLTYGQTALYLRADGK